MKRNIILITITLLSATLGDTQAGGRRHGGGAMPSLSYHFPKPSHYIYHPFAPRSY